MTINLKTEEGKAIFLRLAETADVVVEGFRPGVVRRLGIDYDAVSAVNPGIVYCSISGYGQVGPMRDVPGHDVNYLSYAGVLGLCGRKGDDPTLLPVQVGDVFGGSMMALSGILMALLGRERTGKGGRVDVLDDGRGDGFPCVAGGLLARRRRAAGARLPAVDRDVPLLRGVPVRRRRLPQRRGARGLVLEGADLRARARGAGRGAVRDRRGGGTRQGCAAGRVSHPPPGRVGEAACRIDACVSPVLDLPEALLHPNTVSRRMVVDVASPLGGIDRQLGMPIKIDGVPEAPRRAPLPANTTTKS